MTNLPEFSASRFNLYKTCPRLYKMQYIEGLEGNKHVYTVMGSALHHTIESYYEGNTNFVPVFATYYNEAVASAMDSEMGLVAANLIGKASQLGLGILRGLNWDQFKPTHIEYGFKFPFPINNPRVLMRGFIDMITEDGCIIDHKSGSKKPTATELANNPQLLIYVWAYEQIFGKKPKAVYWHHLRTLELVEAKVMDNYEDKIQKLEETLVKILEDAEFARIPKGYFCDRICAHTELCWPSTTYEESTFTT